MEKFETHKILCKNPWGSGFDFETQNKSVKRLSFSVFKVFAYLPVVFHLYMKYIDKYKI